MQAVVGAGCYPSLLPAVSDRQLPVDGAMRMPRKGAPAGTDADDRFDDSRHLRWTLASNGKHASVISGSG